MKKLEKWRDAIEIASYQFLLRRISITLLRARANKGAAVQVAEE
jgi:hypothetical protein